VKNNDATLVQLAQNYYKMAKETKNLSWLVKRQLQEYDLRILHNLAILMDDWGSCVAECILHIVDILHLSGLLEICWGSCALYCSSTYFLCNLPCLHWRSCSWLCNLLYNTIRILGLLKNPLSRKIITPFFIMLI